MLEYDFLFQGRGRECGEMILWASDAAAGNILGRHYPGGDQTYHSWGYRPVKMEESPDYLGNVSLPGLSDQRGSTCPRQGDPAGPWRLREAFIRNYVFNTAVTVAGCIRAQEGQSTAFGGGAAGPGVDLRAE